MANRTKQNRHEHCDFTTVVETMDDLFHLLLLHIAEIQLQFFGLPIRCVALSQKVFTNIQGFPGDLLQVRYFFIYMHYSHTNAVCVCTWK